MSCFFILNLMRLFEKGIVRSAFGLGVKKALLKLILLSFNQNSLSFLLSNLQGPVVDDGSQTGSAFVSMSLSGWSHGTSRLG